MDHHSAFSVNFDPMPPVDVSTWYVHPGFLAMVTRNQPEVPSPSEAAPRTVPPRGHFICAGVGVILSGLLGTAGGYSIAADQPVIGGVLIGLSGLSLGAAGVSCYFGR